MYGFGPRSRHFDWPWPIPQSKLKLATTLRSTNSLRMMLPVVVRLIWGVWLNRGFLCINPEKRQQSTIQDSWLLVFLTFSAFYTIIHYYWPKEWTSGASGQVESNEYRLFYFTWNVFRWCWISVTSSNPRVFLLSSMWSVLKLFFLKFILQKKLN